MFVFVETNAQKVHLYILERIQQNTLHFSPPQTVDLRIFQPIKAISKCISL